MKERELDRETAVESARKKPLTRREIAWIFTSIVMFILFVVTLILGMTGYFSSVTYLKSDSDIKVGDNFSISVLPNQASVASFTFDGSYLPNEKLPQVVQINAENLSVDVYVRVKAEVFGTADAEFDFITPAHFEKAVDGYYYYDDVLQGGNKITFCNYLLFPSDKTFSSGEKYILTFVVETLETKYDKNQWKSVQ